MQKTPGKLKIFGPLLIQNSFIERITLNLVFNLVKSACNFLILIFLARKLGSDGFSLYAVNLAVVLSIRVFTDFNSQNALITRTASGSIGFTHVIEYKVWSLIQLTFVFFLFWMITRIGLIAEINNGTNLTLIFLFSISVFSQYGLFQASQLISEAIKKTSFHLFLQTFCSVFVLSCVLALPMTIAIFLVCNIIAYSIAEILLLYKLFLSIGKKKYCWTSSLKSYGKYCLPLFPFLVLSFFVEISDRKMIEILGESSAQGYFTIGQHISSFALVIIAASIRPIWVQFSSLFEQKRNFALKRLLNFLFEHIFILFFGFVGFILCAADFLINILLGSEFQAGVFELTILILALPFQALNQILGSALLAFSWTKKYSLVGSITMILSLMVNLLLAQLVPTDHSYTFFLLKFSGIQLIFFICCLLILRDFLSKFVIFKASFRGFLFFVYPFFIISVVDNPIVLSTVMLITFFAYTGFIYNKARKVLDET